MASIPRRWIGRLGIATLLVSLGVAAAALSASGDAPTAAPDVGAFAIEQQAASAPPGLYVSGARVTERTKERTSTKQLDNAALAPLLGKGSPVAVPSPDGRLLAYNSWRSTGPTGGTPTLRLFDFASSADIVLARGAQAPAWRHDGSLAYEQADAPAFGSTAPYQRRILVRDSASASPTVWTARADLYGVIGWAGDRLIVGRASPDGQSGELLAFDRPNSSHLLAVNSGLVAISPDGAHVLVSDGGPGLSTPLRLRLLDVTDGSETASLVLADEIGPSSGGPVEWVDVPGSWRGDLVVMTASPGLLVVRVGDKSVKAEQVLGLDLRQIGTDGVYEPRFVDGTKRIVLWGNSPEGTTPRTFQLDCDRVALTCLRGPDTLAASRPAYDRSGGTE